MSSGRKRIWEVWKSNAKFNSEIHGEFRIELTRFPMVAQSLEYLHEFAKSTAAHFPNLDADLLPFIQAMQNWRMPKGGEPLFLHYRHTFHSVTEFENANILIEKIDTSVDKLEMILDISFNVRSIAYLADKGAGPNKSILHAVPIKYQYGVGFEIEERAQIAPVLIHSSKIDFESHRVALNHYQTGMTNFLLGDDFPGLIDAAFMQFYLCVEAILEASGEGEAIKNSRKMFKEPVSEELIKDLYRVRSQFFGHVDPTKPEIIRALDDEVTSFEIQKQVLVAKWLARDLLCRITGCLSNNRKTRLYSDLGESVDFSGDISLLQSDFKPPSSKKEKISRTAL
ncbi:hypothetical protein [Bdellovibrio bacteriovorus]|uniref:hypothetical protein n=1 Tax=Bdellovibrio bacteriovorus TaxID=959 RepID=UPI003AA8D772